jgi:prepilin-type processing-associated H-X9-DG protein
VRILIHPGGRHADVTFADGHGMKRTLHAYAERPLCVRGEEVIVFRKHKDPEDLEGGVEEEFGAAVDTAWRDDDYRSSASSSSYSRVGKSPNDGAIFVSGFLPGTTLGEISEALAQFGKYERMVMRMFSFAMIPHFLPLLSELVIIRPRFKIRIFYIFEQGSCGGTIACSPTDPYHPPRASPAHRKLREQAVQLVP